MKGSITLVAQLTHSSKLQISVEDTGIGIGECDQKMIFSTFGKLEDERNLNPQGCGLGLSISNILVHKLGGNGISVSSVPGVGSVFSFCVSIHTSSESDSQEGSFTDEKDTPGESHCQPLPETAFWSGSSTPTYPRVLVVDDNSFNRLVARRLIESQGFKCLEAATGREAVSVLKASFHSGHCLTFVLMDIEMPEVSGTEASEEVRRLQQGGVLSAKVTIVGCSANFAPEDKACALRSGMDYFIEKPIQREQLFRLLRMHFRRERRMT